MKGFASPISKKAVRSDENIDKHTEVLKKDQEELESDWRDMVNIGESHESNRKQLIDTNAHFGLSP